MNRCSAQGASEPTGSHRAAKGHGMRLALSSATGFAVLRAQVDIGPKGTPTVLGKVPLLH